MKKLNLLLLEDEVSDADLIRKTLERSGMLFNLVVVSDKNGFDKAIAGQSFDAILADHSMPHFSGAEALALLNERDIDAPFILVTGTVSEEFAVSIMKEGAADYILKDRLQRLPNAISVAVEKFITANERRRERREAELKIAESEQKYRHLFEQNPFPLLVVDVATLRFLDVNKAAIQHYGYSREEFRTMTMRNIGPVGEMERFFKNGRNAEDAATGKVICRHLKKDGTVIYVEINADELNFEGRRANLVIVSDVTDKIKIERELRESEARLNASQRIGHIGGWELDIFNTEDLNANNLRWTDETFHIFGLLPGEKEINPDIFFSMVHPDDRGIIMQAIKLAIEWKREYNIEHRIVRKDGAVCLVHELGEIILDENDRVVKITGTIQDITERKHAEDSLQKSEANLRTIFDNTETGYVLLDADLNIVSFNRPVHKFSIEHLQRPVLEGTCAVDYFSEDKRDDVRRSLQIALRGASPTYEVSFPQTDGYDKWYHASYHPVWNTGRKILGVIMGITDITERKISELQEKKITADLLQRNKDLEQFTYIISHNLRAPVANIIGVSNILNDHDLTPEEKSEFMEAMSTSVKKLDNVITDLNEILQIKNKLDENKEKVNFTQIVHDIKYSISNFAESDYVEIQSDFTEVDEMSTLKSYMHSIFYNLISNSIKYRKVDVPPVIEIKSRRYNQAIELIFKDNCMGIDMEKRGEQVFGLYKRFHPHSAEGKGIGLFMVKTQVETLGGKITLKSEVNKGTEFKIVFEIPEFSN